jgi:hypothetical protein
MMDPFEMDDYEAVNLHWLLSLAHNLNLDTGDWCGQLRFKLEERFRDHPPESKEPNSPPGDTAMRLRSAAAQILKADIEQRSAENVALKAEVERMRPVYEAAKAWHAADRAMDSADAEFSGNFGTAWDALNAAVDVALASEAKGPK